MARLACALLLTSLASLLEECSSLGDPDLSIQVGYFTYTLYSLILFIDTPTEFPTYDGWEYLMTFRAYSIDATELPENSNTPFTCLYQCDTYSTAFWKRTVFMASEAALLADEQCQDNSGDPAYQPICFPDDVSGRSDFQRIVFGDFYQTGRYSISLVSWIQPLRHLPAGDTYDVGGTFNTPAPMIRSQAGRYLSTNFWTVTFNVWAQLNDTVFDSICIAGYGLSEATGLCELCPRDTYRPTYQRTTGDCWLCPQNSTSAIGEVRYAYCRCDTGFGATSIASKVSEEAREGRTSEKYCYACVPGEYGAERSESCEACPEGFYTALPSEGACTAATPGYYQPGKNQSKSLACEAGTYSGWTAATYCTDCADGYFEDTSGSSVCEAAPAGYYTNGTGAIEAFPCSPGYYKALAGAGGSCSKCPAGKYSAEEAAASCTTASPGYYTDEAGQMEAAACTPGSYSGTAGSSSCSYCLPGSFVNTFAASSCQLTTAGHYQNLTGQAEELPCLAGEFSDSGAAACEACPAGYFSPVAGSASCLAAPTGYFQGQVGQTDSVACVPGTYTQFSGSTLCDECEAGSYVNESGSSRCTPCSAGHFQDLTGQVSEKACLPGSYNPSTGMSACFACDPGQNTSSYGQVRCGNCPRGTYGDFATTSSEEYFFDMGIVDCSPCPSISTTAEVGSESIESCLCPEGTWGDPTNCVACSEGMLCRELGLALPKQEKGYCVTARTARRLRRTSDQEEASEADAQAFDVYRCQSDEACPEGLYGTCGPNRDPSSIACGECLDNYFLDRSGNCAVCSRVEASLLSMAFLIIGLICLVCLAFYANRELATQPKAVTVLITTLGTAVAALQMMSIFVNLSVSWMDPLSSCLETLSLLSLNLNVLQSECLIGSHVAVSYGSRQAIAPFGAFLLAVILRCKKRWLSPELHFREEYVNTVGSVMQVLFVAVLVSMTVPFICYGHPNGKSSLVSNPAILCFEDSGHYTMVGIGIVAFCTVVIPFIVLVLYGVFALPAAKRSSPSMMVHLRMFKFLFLQYEPHAYYFGVVNLLRGLLACLVPVVIRDEGAAQVLAVTAILLTFQILVRCIQPWSSTFSNGFDGALSAFVIFLLICVAMSGNFEESDGVIRTASLICFIFCVSGMILGIGFNSHRFLRPGASWEYFICHHKADAGGQARYIQLTLVQMTGKGCFIDSDHLANLDTLFDIVRSKIRYLIVYLTIDTLKRPWCAGEVTIAYLTHKRAIPVQTASFVPPTDDFVVASHILEYIVQSDFALSDYGIGEEALSEAFQWILHSNNLFRVNVRTNVTRRLRLVGIVEDCTGSVSKEWRQSLEAKPGDTMADVVLEMASGHVVVAADPTDDEACAGAGIVMLKISQKVIEAGIMGVKLLHEYPNVGLTDLEEVCVRAQSLIIVLSEGSLSSPFQVFLIMEAMKHIDTKISVVPLTLPSFKFPLQAYFSEYLPETFREKSDSLASGLKAFFKRIAVQFATHASNQVLEAQAVVILDRIDRKRTLWKSNKESQRDAVPKLSSQEEPTLQSDRRSATSSSSTDHVRAVPGVDSEPPQVGSLTSNLRTSTMRLKPHHSIHVMTLDPYEGLRRSYHRPSVRSLDCEVEIMQNNKILKL